MHPEVMSAKNFTLACKCRKSAYCGCIYLVPVFLTCLICQGFTAFFPFNNNVLCFKKQAQNMQSRKTVTMRDNSITKTTNVLIPSIFDTLWDHTMKECLVLLPYRKTITGLIPSGDHSLYVCSLQVLPMCV